MDNFNKAHSSSGPKQHRQRPTRAGVQRKLRDLSALERQLLGAAASSERMGNPASASAYLRQASAVHEEHAQWVAFLNSMSSSSVSPSPSQSSLTSSASSSDSVASYDSRSQAFVLPSSPPEMPPAHALALALCLVVNVVESFGGYGLTARRFSHALVISVVIAYSVVVALSVPSCSVRRCAQGAMDGHVPPPPHWASNVAATELDRKADALPQLQYALRSNRYWTMVLGRNGRHPKSVEVSLRRTCTQSCHALFSHSFTWTLSTTSSILSHGRSETCTSAYSTVLGVD